VTSLQHLDSDHLQKVLGFERKARLFCDNTVLFKLIFISLLLGFERKARLFCDVSSQSQKNQKCKCWDLSVRLGYFVTQFLHHFYLHSFWLGFERKARLFCDTAKAAVIRFETFMKLGFERKARLFCDFLPKFIQPFLGIKVGI